MEVGAEPTLDRVAASIPVFSDWPLSVIWMDFRAFGIVAVQRIAVFSPRTEDPSAGEMNVITGEAPRSMVCWRRACAARYSRPELRMAAHSASVLEACCCAMAL